MIPLSPGKNMFIGDVIPKRTWSPGSIVARALACLFFLAASLAFGETTNPAALSKNTTDAPEDLNRLRAILADKSHPRTWVFTGDSITHGAKHTHGSRTYVEHFAERVRWELGRGQDIVINSGISGNKADDVLRGFDWRVARFQPDVVSIMIGMNDCTRGPGKREEFRNNVRELIRRTRALGAIPVLHSPNTVQPAANAERGDLPAYAAIVIELAREQKTLLVNHWQHWQQNAKDPAVQNEWLNDPIHPGARGHRELAIVTFQVFGIFSTNSPTCQAELPAVH